jgi:hypothetical protein
MKKLFKWGLIALGVLIIIVAIVSLGGKEGQRETTEPAQKEPVQTQEAEPQKEEAVEKPTTTAPKKRLTLEEIYNKVEKGMTEAQVRKIAGEPDMTSEAEIEKYGKVVNLIYYDDMDNITISIQNGTVKIVVLGRYENGKLKTKSKM